MRCRRRPSMRPALPSAPGLAGVPGTPFRRPRNARLDRMLRSPWIHRLDARDRALYMRWVIGESASAATLLFCATLTHIGGITASVAFALIPLVLAEGQFKIAAVQAAWSLAISHLIVQVIKR